MYAGAKMIKERMCAEGPFDNNTVIALLASSDAIPYAITEMAIIRANFVVFPLSTRNSPAAIAHLLNKVDAKHILASKEQSITDLVRDALDIMRTEYSPATIPTVSSTFTFEELFSSPSNGLVTSEELPHNSREPDAPALILHSSGSTAFPKPIVWTNRRLIEVATYPWHFGQDLTGLVSSLHTLPIFHGLAFVNLLWAASTGNILAAFEPRQPPLVPTPDLVFRALQASNCDLVWAVPSFVETWAHNDEYVEWLASRKGVTFGGGPLNKEIGDMLVSRGVNIYNAYGSTEAGMLSVVYEAEPLIEWDYFKIHDYISIQMLPMGDNTYELAVVANNVHRPAVINTKVDGDDAYATSDLVMPHPTKSGYWKVLGRTDDQIMHSTGEKASLALTNPGPLEDILKKDPYVSNCIMFGRGRFQAGVLVQPKSEFSLDPSDDTRVAEFRNKIWPSVEKMNAFAPQHSRIFKEMILIANPSKPFSYTPKGTVRRAPVIKDYEEEIDALYDAVDNSAQSATEPPVHWDDKSANSFTRAVVEKLITVPLKDEDDIFQHGCDSLQATWIRNTILRALRDSAKIDTRKVNSNFVYDHPTISRMASFVLALALGTTDGEDRQSASHADAMRAMVAKYSKDFPIHRGSAAANMESGKVVLITGTTGGLGCYALKELVADPKVARVYAFNRPAKHGQTLYERQKSALADRGLDASIVDSEKVVLLEGDLSAANFGLTEKVYQELHTSVTYIIHNAWRVDFSISLASFESNVYGVRAFIDFALTSPLAQPPRLIYTSSIGVFTNLDSDDDLVEAPIDPDVAIGSGYTESKWVSEEILYNAAANTPLTPVVVRVGQICGALEGSWNAHEWFPSIVQSAPKLGCFPDDERGVVWVPLDVAAQAMVDFMDTPPHIKVVHLNHPRPVSWHSLAVHVAQAFSVPLVPYHEWLAKLEQAALDVSQAESAGSDSRKALQDLHAIQLLPFYRGLAANFNVGRLSVGMFQLDVSQAVAASPTLSDPNVSQLGAEHVKNWLAYWRKVGLLAGQ
ncbi:hypothetical protein POSPLADRAFT_1059977 [Postia placenta MAD-698-R-SB12]|uniref:Polyketide synthase-like phosphopantetheine-binding domain-containing protein n=1 Tax=Postia placenta MAD-698-R-SB12 TaxID=670580 RepID=A0A1X6MR56_9APHY|nr:hypothetical protein POSPLADRAFT_1059977 [Postia placenta MAD-698-R-SB12]OSX58884.1 hypothetical protein POSPLADRAFT_1059977 [Postia placenta MAD-698-R-SB12]